MITAGFMLGEEGTGRLKGLAFSMIAHVLYDLPPLAIIRGVSEELVVFLAIASTGAMLLIPLMAKESVRHILVTINRQEEEEEEVISLP